MLFTLEFLEEHFPSKIGEYDASNQIEVIMTDSREKMNNALFIPIIGDRFDAHDFIMQAIENGATAVIWDKRHPVPEAAASNIAFFLVEDTLKAMQLLAKAYRQLV